MKKILTFLITLIAFLGCENSTKGNQKDSPSQTLTKTNTITSTNRLIDEYAKKILRKSIILKQTQLSLTLSR